MTELLQEWRLLALALLMGLALVALVALVRGRFAAWRLGRAKQGAAAAQAEILAALKHGERPWRQIVRASDLRTPDSTGPDMHTLHDGLAWALARGRVEWVDEDMEDENPDHHPDERTYLRLTDEGNLIARRMPTEQDREQSE